MIILRYHVIIFRLTAPRCPSMAAGAVSLRKSHDIVILSFCNIVKGQAKCLLNAKQLPLGLMFLFVYFLATNIYNKHYFFFSNVLIKLYICSPLFLVFKRVLQSFARSNILQITMIYEISIYLINQRCIPRRILNRNLLR